MRWSAWRCSEGFCSSCKHPDQYSVTPDNTNHHLAVLASILPLLTVATLCVLGRNGWRKELQRGGRGRESRLKRPWCCEGMQYRSHLRKRHRHLRRDSRTNYFFGRPTFNGVRPASSVFSLPVSRFLISDTPMRSRSLFLISKPALRQAFLTWLSTSYSVSGMVKLSRTCLIFFSFNSVFFSALATGFATALTAGFAAGVSGFFSAGEIALTGVLATGFLTTGALAGTAGLAAVLVAAFVTALTAGLVTGFAMLLRTV